MALKPYAERHAEVGPMETWPDPSGVGCPATVCLTCGQKHRANVDAGHELNAGPCPGEMMFRLPVILHEELPSLKRAKCARCNYRGWV